VMREYKVYLTNPTLITDTGPTPPLLVLKL
jgi:hypothetical protein